MDFRIIETYRGFRLMDINLNPEEAGIFLFFLGLGIGIVVGYFSVLVKHKL